MSDEETTPAMRLDSATYGSSGDQGETEIIMPQEEPQTQAAGESLYFFLFCV